MAVPPQLAPSSQSPEERAAAARLLGSRVMVRAPRVAAMLEYVLRCVHEGRAQDISEQSIGVHVFGRTPGYNSSEDNIVRVTARHLRARLEEYYREEGADEAIRIEIPKGSYVPVFSEQFRPAGLAAPPAAPAETSRLRKPGRQSLLAALLVLLLLVPAGFVARRMIAPAPQGLAQYLLLDGGRRLTVVVTDSKLQAYRVVYNRLVPLREYIEQRYLLPGNLPANSGVPESVLRFLRSAPDTSSSSAIAASLFTRQGSEEQVRIRHPREVRMRDLELDSAVLFGGPWINPWGQLFEDRLNFQMVPREHASQAQVLNRRPKPGEKALYQPEPGGSYSTNYARVALTPGLTAKSRVLLLGATSGDAIEAACRFLLSPESVKEVGSALQRNDLREVTYFELLLEVKALADTPGAIRILAHRSQPSK